MNGLLLKLSIDRIEFRVGSIIDCLRLEIIGWKFSESRQRFGRCRPFAGSPDVTLNKEKNRTSAVVE